MRIAVGADHAGYEAPEPGYKAEIVRHLQDRGLEVVDCGTNGPESVDYPDFANKVCTAISEGNADCGLLLCGTGIGMSIAANRHAGIRAAVCTTSEMAILSREHNNANVLCLGRRVLSLGRCLELIDTWLNNDFSNGERHRRRVNKMG